MKRASKAMRAALESKEWESYMLEHIEEQMKELGAARRRHKQRLAEAVAEIERIAIAESRKRLAKKTT